MTTTSEQIQLFDPHSASEPEWAALNALNNRIRAERFPNDPPLPVAHTVSNLTNVPPFVEMKVWAAWNGETMIGHGSAVVLRTEENQHLAQAEIQVLPEMRRRGLGTALLRPIADFARSKGRRLLVGTTYSNVPSGAAFMTLIGGTMALAMHTNELEIDNLDRDLLRTWLVRAPERAADFELGLWEGAYPEDELDAIAALMEAMNQAPTDDLDIEDFHWTAGQIREMDESMTAQGYEHWTMYVREKASGAFAGFTDVYWNPTNPEILSQANTGVFPQYRSKGLGRWLKAAMLEKVLRDRPEVKRVRTGNAHSNAAMLSINTELGFKPLMSSETWQVELDRVFDYLESQ